MANRWAGERTWGISNGWMPDGRMVKLDILVLFSSPYQKVYQMVGISFLSYFPPVASSSWWSSSSSRGSVWGGEPCLALPCPCIA